MSPSETQTPNNKAAQRPSGSETRSSIQTTQPKSLQSMDPERPQVEQPEFGGLRGGDRSSMCPGRFCFCIPCPIPCDFCII
ncbi:hypothetical protein GGR52DRAFT_316750 [Hypoxylon sp. FL1284]|nr:hypothetical protein GGR52DRAFT_316750 [Hypoxylon sp. FL1284]